LSYLGLTDWLIHFIKQEV